MQQAKAKIKELEDLEIARIEGKSGINNKNDDKTGKQGNSTTN